MRIIFTNKLLFLVAMPIIITSIFALSTIQKTLQEDAMEQLKGHMLELVQHYASGIASELDKSTTITNTTAMSLSVNPVKDKDIHYKLLSNSLKQNSVIYGAAIAYEPSYFRSDELFGPYVFRDKNALSHIDIAQDAYDYTEDNHQWYSAPKNLMASVWTEPYFDEGAGDTLMITYSVPIVVQSKFIGAVTADLDLAKLNKTLNLDGLLGSDYVILTNTGHFAYHTNKDLIGKSFINISDDLGFERSIYIARKMITGDKGYVELADKEGKVEMIFYAPIGKYGWSFALALKKESAYHIVFDEADSKFIWIMSLFVIGLIVSIFVAYFSFVKPMQLLNQHLESLKKGKKVSYSKMDFPKEFQGLAKTIFELFNKNLDALQKSQTSCQEQETVLRTKSKLLDQADKRVMGLLSSAQNPVVIINSLGEILSTNQKSESTLKLKVDNMIGESILSFVKEKDKDKFAHTLEELFNTMTDIEIESLTLISRTNVALKVKAIFKPVFISNEEIEANIVFIKIEN